MATDDENNGWTNNMEDLLSIHLHKLKGRAWLHAKTHKHYNKQNNMLGYPSIIITTVCGFGGGFTALGTQNHLDKCDAFETLLHEAASQRMQQLLDLDNNTDIEHLSDMFLLEHRETTAVTMNPITIFTLQLGISLMTLIAAVLSTLQRFRKTSELSESHYNAHKMFSSLHRNISTELHLGRSTRENGLVYMSALRTNMENLYQTSPSSFPDYILFDFYDTFPDVQHKPDAVLEVAPKNSKLRSLSSFNLTRKGRNSLSILKTNLHNLANRASVNEDDVDPDLEP